MWAAPIKSQRLYNTAIVKYILYIFVGFAIIASGWNNHMYKHMEAFNASIDHLHNKQNVTQLTFQHTCLNVQRHSRTFIFRVGHRETTLQCNDLQSYQILFQ